MISIHQKTIVIFFLCITPVLIWSGLGSKRLDLWFAETLPLLIGYTIMVKSYRTFPLTRFSYLVIFTGSTLMLIGAYYSYSYVPLFDWIKNIFEFERNHYDKLIHFFQGLCVTILAREIITRKLAINSLAWINFIAFSCAAALASIWEVVEWLFVLGVTSLGVQEPPSGFLGEQNYYWDAQSDMFFAFAGAFVAIVIFSKYHQRKIKQLTGELN